jgi:hypothetical protein
VDGRDDEGVFCDGGEVGEPGVEAVSEQGAAVGEQEAGRRERNGLGGGKEAGWLESGLLAAVEKDAEVCAVPGVVLEGRVAEECGRRGALKAPGSLRVERDGIEDLDELRTGVGGLAGEIEVSESP